MNGGYLGEIRLFAFPWAPDRWRLCDGAPLPIANHQALYTFLEGAANPDEGTFSLPDLRGRLPIGGRRPGATGTFHTIDTVVATFAVCVKGAYPFDEKSHPMTVTESFDQYIGEIRLMPYGFTPQGWLPCEGQRLSIRRYAALHSVIGGRYGVEEEAHFTLPDMRDKGVVSDARGSAHKGTAALVESLAFSFFIAYKGEYPYGG